MDSKSLRFCYKNTCVERKAHIGKLFAVYTNLAPGAVLQKMTILDLWLCLRKVVHFSTSSDNPEVQMTQTAITTRRQLTHIYIYIARASYIYI